MSCQVIPYAKKVPFFAAASRAVPSSVEGSCTVGGDDKYAGQIETLKKWANERVDHHTYQLLIYFIRWTALPSWFWLR